MKIKSSRIVILVYILSAWFLISCEKEKPDVNPPELTLISPKVNDTLSNEVEIAFNAKDENLSYVECYVNDSFLGKINPPISSIEWNTIQFSDGEYVIKCKAFDKNGNYQEDTRKVFVENTLVKINIGYLKSPYNLLITDSIGNILAKTTFDKNSFFTIKPDKPFYGNSINIIYFNAEGYSDKVISGYFNVKKGFTIDLGHAIVNEVRDLVTVHVKKPDYDFSEVLFSTIGSSRRILSLSDTLRPIQFYYSPNYNLLVQVKRAEGSFYKYYDINSNSLTVDLNEIDLSPSKKTIQFPDNFSGYINLFGYKKTTDIGAYNLSQVFNSPGVNGSKLDVFYPDSFVEYLIYTSSTNKNINSTLTH